MSREQCATVAVRAGIESDRQFGAVVPPICLSSTFSFADLGEPRKHDYSRSGNPTRDLLADALAELEGGCGATITATGMGAITTVLQLLEPGDRLVAPLDCYGGTFRLFDALATKGAFCLEWVDFQDETSWRPALKNARMVWLETPSNPLLRVTDIARVAEGIERGRTLLVADNTFLSPALQQPLALGADIVVHSTTKYINGHSDVVGGAVVAGDPILADKLAWWANCIGVTGSAFDAWLTLRGMRTLSARLAVQQANTLRLVSQLQAHPAVERVYFPGLADHPGHAIARCQQQGFGAMLSFDLAGGEVAVRRFIQGLKIMSLAESLGGVETLLAHPRTMTHAAMSPRDQERAGLGPGLLRLSVGLEALEDLSAELAAALDRSFAGSAGQVVAHAAG